MKQYLLLLKSSDFNKSGSIWVSNPVNLYHNSQYTNYSYTRSAYGLNLIGDRTYVGTELASPSYSEGDATPVSDTAVYVTDIGEVVYDVATPDLLRFIDTSSKIDVLNYKYTFTNLSGTIVPTMNLVVYEADSENGPWLRSISSQDSGIIYISNAKPYIKFECTIDADIVDLNTVGLLMYVEIGIHDPIPKTISDSVRNVARRFPSWTAIFEDSMDPATPSLAIPESTGGKFLTALLQENLERFNSLVEVNDINMYINSADENMLAWVYVSYNVPQNINIIRGDSVELARVSSFSDLLNGRATDYSFFYSAVDKQLVTLRKFETLTINNLIYTQDPLNIYNDFDEFGARLGLPRLYLEGNSNYKKRILDVTANMPGVSMDAFKRTVRRELDLWRAYGATPDSNYLGATPEVLEISDIETSTPYFTESGKPESKFRNFVEYINSRYPSNIGYIRWNEGVWDYAGKIGEGVSRIPAVYDAVASPIGEFYSQGVGDFDDLKLHLYNEESATTSFSGYIDVSGYKKVGESDIYPPILVEYSWYFGYLRTVSDTTSNTVGVELVYEICMPPHDNYSTPSVFYANLNYNNRSDFYVTNRFLSTSNASPEYSYINIFNNEGLSELEFRDKVYNQLYVNSSATPTTNELDIYEAASVNVIFGRTWNPGTQSYTSLGSPQYRAAFSHATASYYVNPTVGTSMTISGPRIHPNDAELKIGSTKYITKLALESTNPVKSSILLNNLNDLATPDIEPKRIYTSDLVSAMSIPGDAIPKYIYLQAATPSNLTYYDDPVIRFEQGGISYDPISDQSYLVPSSPSILWRSSTNDISSTPNYFNNVQISLSSTPDYLEVYSHYNEPTDAVDILSESVVWLDAGLMQANTQYIQNSATGSASGGVNYAAKFGSAVSSDSNDPVLIPFSGENHLYIPNTTSASNSAYIGSFAALDALTGDLELVLRYRIDSITGAVDNLLIERGYAGQFFVRVAANSYMLSLTIGGVRYDRTVSVSNIVGTTRWLKITRSSSSGSIYFYHADDQVDEPTNWTQVGFSAGTAGALTVSSGVALQVGRYSNGAYYRAIVRNGIGGTAVFDADFTKGITTGAQTSFVATTGQTVSISRATSGRKSVAVVRPVLLFGTDDYLEVPADPDGAYVTLNGTSQYVSCPDAAGLDVTGDLELEVIFNSAPDWATPLAGIGGIFGKESTGNRSFLLRMINTYPKRLAFVWSADGTTSIGVVSTVDVPVGTNAIKVTHDVDNGAAGNDTKFYTSTDFGATYAQLGTTVTVAGTTSHYAGTTELALGRSALSGYWEKAASYRRAILRNGIGGTIVADWQACGHPANREAYYDVYGNLWSMTGSPTLSNPNRLNFALGDSFTVLAVVRHWANPPSFGRIVMKATTGATQANYMLLNHNANGKVYFTIASATGIGANTAGGVPTYSMGQSVVLTGIRNTATDKLESYFNTTSYGTAPTDPTTGAISNAQPLVIGGVTGAYNDMELLAVAVFPRALTTAEISVIVDFYNSEYNELFYRNRNVIDNHYPFIKPEYDYFSLSSTPNIFYGFIDEVGNAYKDQTEYINTFAINDTFLSQIVFNRNTFTGIDENYTIDTIKFISDPDYVDVYVSDIDSSISELNSALSSNSTAPLDIHAKRDDAKKNKYAIGINSGFLYMGEREIYLYNSPITETYNGRLFSITLDNTPRMGAPVIAKIAGEIVREVAFEDSATPGKFSFLNTETVLGNRGNSLYLAYENIKNASVVDTYNGITLFNNLSSNTNVISPFSAATPAVIGREYEVTYYVNDAFYVDKDAYNASSNSYESIIYFSSTPSINSSYEITYESSRYNKSIDSELTVNQLDSPISEGFVFIDENVSPFDTIEYHLSPGFINDSGGDFMTLSIISYDENGNFKPHQTFSVSSTSVDVLSNSDLVTVNIDGSAYVTTNENGFAAVALKYAGAYPATNRTGSVSVVGLNSTNPNAHINSEAGSYSENISFEIIRNLSFNLQVKASPVNMVVSADGVTDIVIVGRVYWRDIPLNKVINLGWNKARTLYDLFQASPSNLVSTDSNGYFVISGQITAEDNTNPGQWFARVEILDSAEDIKLLLPVGEVTEASDITISGDIVYWNEKYDNVHFTNEELPLSNIFIHEKQDGADLIATPNFVYSHHDSLTVSHINATPNWTPSKWVALNRFDQYQMGLFGTTPNYISDYTQIHPDSGEE